MAPLFAVNDRASTVLSVYGDILKNRCPISEVSKLCLKLMHLIFIKGLGKLKSLEEPTPGNSGNTKTQSSANSSSDLLDLAFSGVTLTPQPAVVAPPAAPAPLSTFNSLPNTTVSAPIRRLSNPPPPPAATLTTRPQSQNFAAPSIPNQQVSDFDFFGINSDSAPPSDTQSFPNNDPLLAIAARRPSGGSTSGDVHSFFDTKPFAPPQSNVLPPPQPVSYTTAPYNSPPLNQPSSGFVTPGYAPVTNTQYLTTSSGIGNSGSVTNSMSQAPSIPNISTQGGNQISANPFDLF
jgi:hypothetical protein